MNPFARPARTQAQQGWIRLPLSLAAMLAVSGLGMGSWMLLFMSRASALPTPTPTPTIPISKPVNQPDAAAQKLLGQWRTKVPLKGDTIVFIFAPNGEAFLISNPTADGGYARPIRYQVNPKPRPMHLDVILNDSDTVLTVFELTAAGELRLQMLGTRPGARRPVALREDATLFEKVSDATTLPPNMEVITPRQR